MNIELVTKNDIHEFEIKLNTLIQLLQVGTRADSAVYTTEQLAHKLHVSKKTIQNWREQKLIEYSQINNKIYYTGKSVEDFLAIHSIKRISNYRSIKSSNC